MSQISNEASLVLGRVNVLARDPSPTAMALQSY